ncbi:MAG: nucleoside triphosphate pyrophosphohydrolase [Chloroflexi bacterium]|nr:MAG: nucleoside triphosphate pyrophosphohydrolase [Chloroflexota bacterium]
MGVYMTLTIVGLGPGAVDDLSRRAWRTLKQAERIFLRTEKHGCVSCLPQMEQTYTSFDDLYESLDSFELVYERIVERVMDAARRGDVVYAVPGDPLVGESTVLKLMDAANKADIAVEIVNGISFVEPSLKLIGVDALDGLQVVDALAVAALHHPPINPDYPALLGQVYSKQVASDVKLTLMNQYRDEFPVTLIHAAGTDKAAVEAVPLYEIDRSEHISHTTSLYIPSIGDMSSFEQFQEIIAHLRAPEGCPWDRKQTHLSLREYLIEETYEVLEALDNEDAQALCEELGDLLIQVALHTQIAIDDGEFRMTDVLSHVNEKLVRRHPHVWGDVQVDGAEQVLTNWDALKEQENANKGKQRESILDGIPKGSPALLQAYKLQAKAAKPGFDWDDAADVLAKVREEIDEILAAEDDEQRAKEVGDLLFAVVNWARWLDVEPETALRETNQRFYRRFRYIEEAVAANGKALTDYSLAELDALWNEAKAQGL